MDMKRKKLVLAVSAAVLLGGYTVGIFGQTEGDLTQKQICNMKKSRQIPHNTTNILLLHKSKKCSQYLRIGTSFMAGRFC